MSIIDDNLKTAYQIGRYIHSLIDNDENLYSYWESHFKDGPNSGFNQTESGLFLEEYYGTPSRIFTNIGSWNIVGSSGCKGNGGGWKNIIKILQGSLDLELHKEMVVNNFGCFGPIWKIKSFNGITLDDPLLKEYRDYNDYSESKDIWNNFKKLNKLDYL
jgi:hypothetical protein